MLKDYTFEIYDDKRNLKRSIFASEIKVNNTFVECYRYVLNGGKYDKVLDQVIYLEKGDFIGRKI